MTVTVGTGDPRDLVQSYATYGGWWCWACDGGGCECCGHTGEHTGVLPPPCAPPAALTGLDRRWWGIGADDEDTEVPRG